MNQNPYQMVKKQEIDPDWYCVAEQLSPALHLARPEGRAAHCASYCAPCQPLLQAFSGRIRSPPATKIDPSRMRIAQRGTWTEPQTCEDSSQLDHGEPASGRRWSHFAGSTALYRADASWGGLILAYLA